jgi:hypothetical protein
VYEGNRRNNAHHERTCLVIYLRSRPIDIVDPITGHFMTAHRILGMTPASEALGA